MKIQMELIPAVVIDRNDVDTISRVGGGCRRRKRIMDVWWRVWMLLTGGLGETRECDLDRLSRVLPLDFVGSGSPTSRNLSQSCR